LQLTVRQQGRTHKNSPVGCFSEEADLPRWRGPSLSPCRVLTLDQEKNAKTMTICPAGRETVSPSAICPSPLALQHSLVRHKSIIVPVADLQ